jgi:hypothetical protein
MTYKVRHKGKHKASGLPPGLAAPLVQVLLIIAVLITAVLLPRPAEGKSDVVSIVAVIVAAAGVALLGLTRLAQAALGRWRRREGPSAVLTFLYRVSFVMILSGIVAAFYRAIFH